MMFTKRYGNNLVEYNDADCEEGIENAFINPDTNEFPSDIQSFIGLAFHACQQCGGILRLNGTWILPLVMDQTSGDAVDLKDIIRTQGKALLEPLGLEVTDQQINLIEHWVSLHPENILEHLKIEQA